MARRKPGTLLRIELAILEVGIAAARDDAPEFHGFAAAQRMPERDGARRLTGHGTLYKALGRMEAGGLLESRWEDPELGIKERRPRRRLYRVTPLGVTARNEARVATAAPQMRPGLVT
jgi:PadR family transcriptional regulator PadR